MISVTLSRNIYYVSIVSIVDFEQVNILPHLVSLDIKCIYKRQKSFTTSNSEQVNNKRHV